MPGFFPHARKFVLLTAAFILPGLGATQTPQGFEPKQLQEDFQIARKALEEAHSGIYRYVPKAELDRHFDAAAKSVNQPLDAWGFYRLLTPLVANLRCGHTAVLPSPSLKREMERALLLPLDVKVLKERSRRFAEVSFLDQGRIACLKVFNFTDKEEDEEGVAILRRTFETIQAKGSQTLILDLRGNGGGEDELGKVLFSYLVETPFRYYDDLILNRPSPLLASYAERFRALPGGMAEPRPDGRLSLMRHPNLGLQQPSQPTFRGRLLVLIDGGCFSTTAEFLTQVHDHRRATFIGEESGGGYFGNTSGRSAVLTLPYTKLRLVVPLVTYQLAAKGPHDAGRGVLPDHPVHPTIEDDLADRDPGWALALALARKP